MPRPPKIKQAIKDLIVHYLHSIYLKQSQGEQIDDYDINVISKKINLIKWVYDNKENKIIETDSYDNNEDGMISVSTSTINNAIDELLKDGYIEIRDRKYCYKPTDAELHIAFPILKMASNIKIEPLNVTDLMFYRTSEPYTELVTNYINAQFHRDDICAVNLGGIIMCMDFQIPKKSSSVIKRYPLEKRIHDVLRPFALESPKFFDDSNGLTQDDLNNYNESKAIASEQYECEMSADYGGRIKSRPIRKIKRIKKQK